MLLLDISPPVNNTRGGREGRRAGFTARNSEGVLMKCCYWTDPLRSIILGGEGREGEGKGGKEGERRGRGEGGKEGERRGEERRWREGGGEGKGGKESGREGEVVINR